MARAADAETEPGSWRRLALVAAIAALLVGGLAVAGYYLEFAGGRAAAKADPKSKAEQLPADQIALTEQQLRQIRTEEVRSVAVAPSLSAIGQIAYNEDLSTPVPAPYAGRIVRVLAKLGDAVQPGAPLFEIESPDIVQAQTDFLSATGAVAKAKTQTELAKRVSSRQDDLHRAGAASQKDWEQAQADLHTAETELRSATGAYLGARDRLRLLGRNDAEINRLEQERRIDPLAVVRAPIGGTVTLRKVGPGQWVRQDNADPLFAISDLSSMWLIAKVPETEIAAIALGQPVEVDVPAFPKERFTASVSYVGPAVDPATHRVVVRSDIENPGRKLKPEMFATFRIATRDAESAPAVPVSALVRDLEITEIWVERDGRRYEKRKVEIGPEQGGLVQIRSGVAAGERVVVQGGVFLTQALVVTAR